MSKVNPYGECKDCRFFFSEDPYPPGDCRKISLRGDDWPKVDPLDGCGEFMKLSDRQLEALHGPDFVSSLVSEPSLAGVTKTIFSFRFPNLDQAQRNADYFNAHANKTDKAIYSYKPVITPDGYAYSIEETIAPLCSSKKDDGNE
jgi:hypothetical protein